MSSRIVLFVLGCTLSGCATQPLSSAVDPPGFLMGAMHGFLCVFSLIGSFFLEIRVYSFPNSGHGYDVGFVIGAALFFAATTKESFDKSYVLGYADGAAAEKQSKTKK